MFITNLKTDPELRRAGAYLAALAVLSFVFPIGLCAFFCIAWIVAFFIDMSGRQRFLNEVTRARGYFAVLVPYQALIATWGFCLVWAGKTPMFIEVIGPVTLFVFVWLWPAVRLIRRKAQKPVSTRYALAALGIVIIIYQFNVMWSYS